MKINLGGSGVLSPILCADHLCINNMGGGPYGVCMSPCRPLNSRRTEPMYVRTCQHREQRPVIKDDGEKTDSGLLEEE